MDEKSFVYPFMVKKPAPLVKVNVGRRGPDDEKSGEVVKGTTTI
jgi:hypothetical protein